MFFMYA